MKRALAFAIVFCMSINSFAAIVSDNDGSAFITKAEFDSLKNTFQSQIDNYNSSIDSKIDGAIAAYLAGIKTSSKSTVKLLAGNLVDTKEYVFENGRQLLTMVYPSLSYTLDVIMWNVKGKTTSDSARKYLLTGKFSVHRKETYASSTKVTRPLVKNSKTTSTSGYYLWDGEAIRYEEKWDMHLNRAHQASQAWPGYIDSNNYTHTFEAVNPFCFNQVTNNNYSNILTDFRIKYTNSSTDSTRNLEVSSWTKATTQFNWSVNYGLDANGNDRQKQLACRWKNNESVECFDQNNGNYFTVPTDQTYTGNTAGTYYKNYIDQWGRKSAIWLDEAKNFNSFTDVTFNISNTTTKLPQAGRLGTISTNSLYLFWDKKKFSVGKNSWEIQKLKLPQGALLFGGDEDDTLSYNFYFDTVKCFNAAPNSSLSNYSTNANEVDIYFSYDPFTTGSTTSDVNGDGLSKISFKDSSGNTIDHLTTTNRKVSFKLKMPKKNVIYVKAVPKFKTTYNGINNWWEIHMNMDDTYAYYTLQTDK